MSSSVCQVIIEDSPHSGSWNMAFDEALLMAAIEQERCAVRVYQWSEATVSLGYFQSSDSIGAPNPLSQLPVVRRLSGGGAILHHLEITYSCVIPATHPAAREPATLYSLVHEAIIARLERRGIETKMRGQAQTTKDGAFLCFGRGDPRDILLSGHKVVGSAQRRRRGAILQHGSVLLRRSPFAPQFPGVFDLVADGRSLRVDRLNHELGLDIAHVLGEPVASGSLDQAIEQTAVVLEDSKYRFLDWRRISDA